MAAKNLISVNVTYQRRFSGMPLLSAMTFGCATMGANGVPNQIFLAFLYSNTDVGVPFLEDVGAHSKQHGAL
jgi:hypothetical protein